MLESGEIQRRDVVKYFAVRRWLFFEKTSLHELCDGLRNFRGPLSNAGVEHPPVKDTVDGVLCLRMPGQIVENFRRRRWKRKGRQTHIWGQSPICSNRRARVFGFCNTKTNYVPPPLARVSIPPLKNALAQEHLCSRPNANRGWTRERQ